MAENVFSWHLVLGEGNTLWLGTAVNFQLNLEHSGDIFQTSHGVSTQNISRLAKSGRVGSALLICRRGGRWGSGAGVQWGEARIWADSVGNLSHT